MKLIHGVLKHLKTIAIPWMLLGLYSQLAFFHLLSIQCFFEQKNFKIFIAINYIGVINSKIDT